ncbi:MAG: hypothetical protein A2293_06670 [Elusimicrobia bacterium RIFOXYB2_FULL_49_7]|nr:MAG: hypothetical protein A2293_06670 [Elusimicrobia bacterium RIFOXYB2_FULL_49_7]
MINRNRTLSTLFFISLAFVAVAARLFYLQVWHHEELQSQVQRIIYRDRPETPWRGMICDNAGRVLAMSVKTYSLFIDPQCVKNLSEIENKLAQVHIPLKRSLIAAKKDSSYVPIAQGIDLATMKKIKSWKLPGVGFTGEYHRQYPENTMACHVLGMVGKESNGLEGIELFANSYLTGEKIKNLRCRDGRGREISEKLLDPDDLRGADVYLTLDRNLQFMAEQEIDRAWRESKSKKALIIIQDPSTGEILALASRPAFNPQNRNGAWNNSRNPAISDILEPGSTFKIITAAAALEEKVVSRKEVVWCEEGKYSVFGHTIKDHEPKGLLSFDEIMQYSSNIGVAKISQRLGKEKLYHYVRQFGFHAPTGIDLPGEAKGLLKLPTEWSGLSLPTISFGQEIGVTPIQMINAYSAIANGGELLEPRIIKEVRNPSNEVVFTSDRRVIRRAVSQAVAAQLRDMLIGVVEKGTGQMAKVPNYSVGGKTGTAQKRDNVTKRYSSSAYVASFCGIIPANDPKLTIMVLLDEPKGDYWASSLAAPVFSRVAARAVGHLRIAPDHTPICVALNKKSK